MKWGIGGPFGVLCVESFSMIMIIFLIMLRISKMAFSNLIVLSALLFCLLRRPFPNTPWEARPRGCSLRGGVARGRKRRGPADKVRCGLHADSACFTSILPGLGAVEWLFLIVLQQAHRCFVLTS